MNLKKIMIGCGVVFGLLIVLMATAFMLMGQDSTGDEQALSDGTLTVALIAGDDMYCYQDGDSYSGIEPMLADSIAATSGASCALVSYDTKAEAMSALTSREVDLVLARMSSTDSAISGFSTSSAYGTGGVYLVTQQGVYLNSLSLLSDRVVAISSEISTATLVEISGIGGVTQMTVTAQDDYESLLTEGIATAVLCTEWEAVSLALSGGAVQVQPLTNSPSESYVAVMHSSESTVYTVANLVVNAYLDGYFDS